MELEVAMINGILNLFAYIAVWLRNRSLAGGGRNVLAICMDVCRLQYSSYSV